MTMARRLRFGHLLPLLVVALALVGRSAAQSGRSAVEEWIRSQAWRLDRIEPDANTEDLRQLRPLIDGARVVALGEPSHGNHEPLAFRNRLFQFLVEEMGFTAIAIESGFSEAGGVQKFIASGDGTADEVVRDSLTYGFGRFKENAALVQWMRDYNADPAHRRKVAFYGIAIGLGGPRTATPTPVTLEVALAYVRLADAEAARSVEQKWRPWLERLRVSNPEEFSPAEHDVITAAIDDLIALFEQQRTTFVAKTSSADYEWAYRNAIAAREADRMFRVMPPPERGRIPAAAWRQMNAGDEAMAQKVRWILEREGPTGRVLVFAHNTHVQDALLEGGVWSGFERPPEPLGMRLRAMVGEQLRIIGTAGATSAEGLPFTDPGPDSVDAVLARVGVPQFVIGWRTGQRDPGMENWLQEGRRMRSGATFEVVSPGRAFDGLVFIDRLTPARGSELSQ